MWSLSFIRNKSGMCFTSSHANGVKAVSEVNHGVSVSSESGQSGNENRCHQESVPSSQILS